MINFNLDHDIPHSAEVVIIGGEVIGLSTAFQLTKRGIRPLVLERRQLGAGATGKSGAVVREHYANPYETRLTLASIEIFQGWTDYVGYGDPDFRAIGFNRVVRPEDEMNLRRNVAIQQSLGGDTFIVEARQLRELEPLMRTDDLTVAAFEPASGYADPNATLFGFAGAAAMGGAQIRTNTEVLKIVIESGQVTGVDTAKGFISTPIVVLAAGAFANRILSPLEIDFGLLPRRSRVVLFRWPESFDATRRHRVVIDSTQQSWFRPEGDASTLIGVTYGNNDGRDPDDFQETIEQEYVDHARQALAARFPTFSQATMRGGWSGVYMQSADDHPIIDKIPSMDGLFVMTGDSGTSFETAPAIGKWLAEWIVDGAPQLADLTPFRSSWFAEGKPWIDEHAYNDGLEQSIAR